MNIEHETVARWFNYVRENTLNIKRFTECFWDTQLKSKAEIIDNLPQDLHGNYYVFGGWYGVLAHLLNDNIVADEIYSVDIDEKCKEIGDIYFRNENLTYVTADMKNFEYPKKPDVVIFEGWCVGANHQTNTELKKPLNLIEKNMILIVNGEKQ